MEINWAFAICWALYYVDGNVEVSKHQDLSQRDLWYRCRVEDWAMTQGGRQLEVECSGMSAGAKNPWSSCKHSQAGKQGGPRWESCISFVLLPATHSCSCTKPFFPHFKAFLDIQYNQILPVEYCIQGRPNNVFSELWTLQGITLLAGKSTL